MAKAQQGGRGTKTRATRRSASLRQAPGERLSSTAAVAVKVRRFDHAKDLALPAYQSTGAAGLDLLAALPSQKPVVIKPGRSLLVPTAIAIELPAGYEGQVRPRSGLAAKHGVTVLNSPGTIDCDYRGEIQVLLVNLGERKVKIRHGDRIAQLVIAPVVHAALIEVAELAPTARADGGFGSTGMKKPRTGKSGKR
ncbi:MAG: dUTP diphosphatase [Hyphomicrobiaceae bacterium]